MKTLFIASGVEVLNFSHRRDWQGHVIPPEAFATFSKSVPVFYGPEDSEHLAGKAILYRKSNTLYADLSLTSTWPDKAKSEAAIRALYPATCFRVLEAVGPGIFKFRIESLTLTPHGNADESVQPIGKRLMRLADKSELN